METFLIGVTYIWRVLINLVQIFVVLIIFSSVKDGFEAVFIATLGLIYLMIWERSEQIVAWISGERLAATPASGLSVAATPSVQPDILARSARSCGASLCRNVEGINNSAISSGDGSSDTMQRRAKAPPLNRPQSWR